MKKIVYIVPFLLGTLWGCVEQEPISPTSPQGDTEVYTFSITDTRAVAGPSEQIIDRVIFNKADTSSAARISFPRREDIPRYDEANRRLIIQVPKTSVPINPNWFTAGTQFHFTAFNAANYGKINTDYQGKGEIAGVQYYDFKPNEVENGAYVGTGIYDWMPLYRSTGDGELISGNGIYSYAKDVLNVGNIRKMASSDEVSNRKVITLAYFDNKDYWNNTVPNRDGFVSQFSGRYIRNKMVYQYDAEFLKKVTHARVMYYNKQSYNPNQNGTDAYQDGNMYRNFGLRSALARVVINLRVKTSIQGGGTNNDWWINDLKLCQIPQFFRIGKPENFTSLLDLNNYTSEESITSNGTWTGGTESNPLSNKFTLDNLRDNTQLLTLSNKITGYFNQFDSWDNKMKYHVAMTFHLVRNQGTKGNGGYVIDTSGNEYRVHRDSYLVPQNNTNFQYNEFKEVLDAYIPPFYATKDIEDWLPRGTAQQVNSGRIYPFMEKKFLRNFYFPHIRIEYHDPVRQGDFAYVVPIGEPNTALRNKGGDYARLTDDDLLNFPSNVQAGHTYVINISIGFGSDVLVETYRADEYPKRILNVSVGKSSSGMLEKLSANPK